MSTWDPKVKDKGEFGSNIISRHKSAFWLGLSVTFNLLFAVVFSI
jgi:hypothetical protein